MGRLAVVILTFNGRADTLACLASLRGQLEDDDAILLVDNDSWDGTREAVEARFPEHEYLRNDSNLGFAGGNNVGIRRALELDFEFVLLLNNDTIVPDGTLADLLRQVDAAMGSIGVFQPLLLRSTDSRRIDSAGHGLRRSPGVFDLSMGELVTSLPSDAERVPVFGACGAAALFRSSVLREVGLLDEELFVLVEDADLMFRVRCAGFDVVLLPTVCIEHRRGVSSAMVDPVSRRRRKFWLQRNILAVGLRYWPLHWLVLTSPLLAWRFCHALVLGARLHGERCIGLWWRSLRARGGHRRSMRSAGVDRWIGAGRLKDEDRS